MLVITDWIVAPRPGVFLPAGGGSNSALNPPQQDSPFVNDNLPEDDGVLHQREEDEEHAGEEPDLQGRHRVGDRDPRGGGVEHVYQDKTQGDQQDNSGRNDILQRPSEIQQPFFIGFPPAV